MRTQPREVYGTVPHRPSRAGLAVQVGLAVVIVVSILVLAWTA
jgi:hypothetical protein